MKKNNYGVKTMNTGEYIKKLRKDKNMTREQFGDIFGVSGQSVQKWENGQSLPETAKLVKIAQYFGVSLDDMLLSRDARVVEIIKENKQIKPEYEKIHVWEDYAFDVMNEYKHSIEEGLDIEVYAELFKTVSSLPRNEIRHKLSEVLFEIVTTANTVEGYKYNEPSDLESIKALRKPYPLSGKVDKNTLEDKIHGAWVGRIAGCFLGKAVEGIRTNEFVPFLKKTNNYPMHRYILSTDCTDENCEGMNYRIGPRNVFPDTLDYMPTDDDTNYMVIGQLVVENYGRDFTPENMMEIWLKYQPKDAYCTAERRAFINFVAGFRPPHSASYKNPYREWIGAQIRGDYFGYINPGNTEMAAEMGWRDACISHVKNGIYGEMFASAMIAAAALTDDVEEIILAGLGEIPETSRLYESIMTVMDMYKSGKTSEETFDYIHSVWDEYTGHGWCHTISNAMVVAASLLYGKGDFGKSICLSVQTGFDTDCNGATVGSILGMAGGYDFVPDEWKKHLCDTLETSIFGYERVKISECAKKTMSHIS